MTLFKSIFYGFLVFANFVFFTINGWEAYYSYAGQNRLAIFGFLLTFIHLCLFVPIWFKARRKESVVIATTGDFIR